jgi:hypothetical protein
VAVAGERGEARRDHHSLVDRRLVALLEVAQEPAGRDPGVPARILAGDQERQLERVDKAERRELRRSCHGAE